MIRLFLIMLALASPATGQTCRQALALGLDVSGSVDAREYRLQLDGLAEALGHPDVVDALLSQAETPIRLAVYEWSQPGDARVILNWTDVTDTTRLATIQSTLRTTGRADMGPSTGLGAALQIGFSLLDGQKDCWNRTLDISGDGKGNTGQRPQDILDTPFGVTVNGLVIGVDDGNSGHERDLQIGELTAYYTAYVIRGPNAFVEPALGFEDYANAMRRKLLRELTTLAIGQLNHPLQ
jgi:hypothetical protein